VDGEDKAVSEKAAGPVAVRT
jgi:hypothetical protein